MLEVKRFIFGLFQTNTYVVNDDQQVLLVDPACSNEYERQQLLHYIESIRRSRSNSEVGLSLIATHGHLDHLWGAKWATDTWQTPILMHEADIPMAKAMQQQYELFGIRATAEEFPIKGIQRTDRFADRVQTDLQIIETPGHTQGSVCLYWSKEKVLLSGDTLFRMGYGRTDLPGGNMGQLIDSLNTLFALPEDVLVYPGHGEPTTIGAERR